MIISDESFLIGQRLFSCNVCKGVVAMLPLCDYSIYQIHRFKTLNISICWNNRLHSVLSLQGLIWTSSHNAWKLESMVSTLLLHTSDQAYVRGIWFCVLQFSFWVSFCVCACEYSSNILLIFVKFVCKSKTIQKAKFQSATLPFCKC